MLTKSNNSTSATSTSNYERPGGTQRLKTRDENSIRWTELIDKFKSVQEKSRRSQRSSQRQLDQQGAGAGGIQNPSLTAALSAAATADQGRGREKTFADVPRGGIGGSGLGIGGAGGRGSSVDPKGGSLLGGAGRSKSSLSNFGRLGIGNRRSKR